MKVVRAVLAYTLAWVVALFLFPLVVISTALILSEMVMHEVKSKERP